MKPTLVHGQLAWTFQTDVVKASLTVLGGHLAPVTFTLGKKRISPYAIAPWTETPNKENPPLMRVLRGDFFCLPFGDNAATWRGERHPPHGETANGSWTFAGIDRSDDHGTTTLRSVLRTKIRPGLVEKQLTLRAGHCAVYSRHVLSGFDAAFPCAYHPMLQLPVAAGSGFISTSSWTHGQVVPPPFEDPAKGGYSCLRLGAKFQTLRRVPMATGAFADLSRYPVNPGFIDIVMISNNPNSDFGWTAVSVPSAGYVWFALKDPRLLGHTVFWLNNGGRHYSPWNGKFAAVLGVEDASTYFIAGLAESVRRNPLSRAGFNTCVRISRDRRLAINHITGVAAIPPDFGRVRMLRRVPNGIELSNGSGMRVFAPVDVAFLYGQPPR